MRRVCVGEVIELQRRKVDVDPAAEYAEIGVRSFGRGIFHKEPLLGIELGNKRVFEVHPGDLILSNVFAWEGAVGLAQDSERGRIGSHRFMTYTPKSPDVDANYLRYYFTSEDGIEKLGIASPGSAGRNRTLAVERFEAIELSLPDIDKQRRVAEHLGRVRAGLDALSERAASVPALSEAAIESSIQRIFDQGLSKNWRLVPLAEVADINPRRAKLDSTQKVAFVPMSALDDVTGSIVSPEDRLVADVGSGFKQFLRGDVIFARITPSMQNGKSAVVSDDLPEVGYGSTEFHVIRPGGDVAARWIHAVVRSRNFRLAAAERFTGTAGQQRVPASFLEEVRIPLPGTLEEQEGALQKIDRLRGVSIELRGHRLRREALIAATWTSALNRAFAGLA